MNARVPPVPSRTNASTINTGIFISTSLTVVPDTVQVNRSVDEREMNAQMPSCRRQFQYSRRRYAASDEQTSHDVGVVPTSPIGESFTPMLSQFRVKSAGSLRDSY